MRVANSNNRYIYQQKKANAEQNSFAELYKDMAANKPSGTQVKLTTDTTDAETTDHVESSVVFGILQHYEADNMPEPVTSLSLVPPPKYPQSIYNIPLSNIKDEIFAASQTVRYMVEEGMSKLEVFQLVKETFTAYFGKDFMTLAESQYRDGIDGFYTHESSDRDFAAANLFFCLQEHGLQDVTTAFWNNYDPNRGDMMGQLEMWALLKGR